MPYCICSVCGEDQWHRNSNSFICDFCGEENYDYLNDDDFWNMPQIDA
jgi:hypothetical protein